MQGLYQYITENNGTSDNAIFYRNGILMLNYMETGRAKNIIDKYRINKNDPRPGVLRYMHDTQVPLIKDKDEVIHRSQWDLDSLIGETEMQLMHDDYYKVNQYILNHEKAKHDILTLFQCSSVKPYYANNHYKRFSKYFGDFSDFACISNPGIIPFDYSDCYPYRYDEWNIGNEKKLEEIIDLTNKYRIVNMCRFINFVKKLGYKHVLISINNPFKQWIFDEMLKKNIAGCKDWMHIVTTDSLRDSIERAYPQLKGGLAWTRMMITRTYYKRYGKELKALLSGDELKHFEEVYKENMPAPAGHSKNESYDLEPMDMILEDWRVDESLLSKNPQVKEHIAYKDFLKKFKDEIQHNMENGKIDKGENNMYYKSYYWTALDLLMMAMDGDLVEDIDKEYWDMVKDLTDDKDFVKIGDFVFCYKPLMDKDDVSEKTLEREATDMGIVRLGKLPKLKLKSSLFN